MSDDDPMLQLLNGVQDGQPARYQLDPDERDPVTNDTAEEALETYQKSGLVNPFHAGALQQRQHAEQTTEE